MGDFHFNFIIFSKFRDLWTKTLPTKTAHKVSLKCKKGKYYNLYSHPQGWKYTKTTHLADHTNQDKNQIHKRLQTIYMKVKIYFNKKKRCLKNLKQMNKRLKWSESLQTKFKSTYKLLKINLLKFRWKFSFRNKKNQ